jgi:hypothetical protein
MAGSVDILAQRLLQTQTRLDYQERSTKGVRTGTVISVSDPEDRGRALVQMDTENSNYIGAGVEAQNPSQTYWVNSVPAFVGKLPPTVVGQRVILHTGNNDEGQLFIQDVIRDKMDKDAPAQSSTMVRMPMYPSGSLPPPGQDNLGCTVVELDGPCNSDWLCTCLRRRGKYLWIRHIDLNHIHQDQDDGRQPPDSSGDGEAPVDEGPIWDKVAPTTDEAYSYQSYDILDSDWFGGA